MTEKRAPSLLLHNNVAVHWISDHIHLGDLPTWLAAIGAAVAAVFAFGQLKVLRGQVEQQRLDLAKVEETQRKQAELLELEIRDRREAQARSVLIRTSGLTLAPEAGAATERQLRKVCRVHNSSSGAIAEVNVMFMTGDTASPAAFAYDDTPTGGMVTLPKKELSMPVERIDAGSTVMFLSIGRPEELAEATTYEVTFKDSRGRRWRVDAEGQLHDAM